MTTTRIAGRYPRNSLFNDGAARRGLVPAGWTVRVGSFNVPRGLTAEMATKGPKAVKFALVGGS